MAVDRIGDGLALRSKGDIVSHDGTANIVQSVGTDGQILTAQSSTSSGLQWVTPPVPEAQYFDHIATASATAGVASLTISSIPSSYTDLVLYVMINTATTGGNSDGQVRFNSNSTADAYKNQYFYYGSNVSALVSYGYELDYTAVWTGSTNSRTSGRDPGLINLAELRIYDYASTTKWKQVQMICSSLTTSSSDIFFAGSGHAQWRNTSAITSITYDTSASATHNIVAGSKIMLFGIKRYGQ
jgi:hypothetical protein